jgi:hypothetical protein
MNCRYQHQGEGSYTYNDPYHESPIDFDKHDEMFTTQTTGKSSTKYATITMDDAIAAQRQADANPLLEVKKHKKYRKGEGPPERPLATGCAADYEIFPRTIVSLELDLD